LAATPKYEEEPYESGEWSNFAVGRRIPNESSIRHRPGRPWSSWLWLFVPINDELAVALEGSKARLKSSQHGYRDLGITTFLKRSSNNVALASDAFPAFDDEAFNLR
jgi:hypothetical protein